MLMVNGSLLKISTNLKHNNSDLNSALKFLAGIDCSYYFYSALQTRSSPGRINKEIQSYNHTIMTRQRTLQYKLHHHNNGNTTIYNKRWKINMTKQLLQPPTEHQHYWFSNGSQGATTKIKGPI